jgi:hypothetical protein
MIMNIRSKEQEMYTFLKNAWVWKKVVLKLLHSMHQENLVFGEANNYLGDHDYVWQGCFHDDNQKCY